MIDKLNIFKPPSQLIFHPDVNMYIQQFPNSTKKNTSDNVLMIINFQIQNIIYRCHCIVKMMYTYKMITLQLDVYI